ncbi:MAG TPA: hypothetical protein VL172_00245 [Kofleriaceae bacterium]|nr:hypothetical protein [Kofleriaceae bacterium]
MQLRYSFTIASAIMAGACGGGSGNHPDAAATADAAASNDAPTPDAANPDAEATSDAMPDAMADAECPSCDTDGDGVLDGDDACPDTAVSAVVNPVGCSDAQVDPTLNATWPPYSLDWTPAGNMGGAGGMTWTYSSIDHGDLFHIYWLPCDDPGSKCGLSLDGPIDDTGEYFAFSASDSNLPNGVLVLVNTTQIPVAGGGFTALNGRLTMTLVDSTDTPMAWQTVAALGVTARAATHGAEITGTGFKVTVLGEVQESGGAWTPYQQYFDAAAKPDPYPPLTVSFGGSFYDE